MADVESGKQRPKGSPEGGRARGSLEALVDFFDNHDMGDDLDAMPEAQFDVDIRRRRHFVEVDEGLISDLVRIAKTQRMSAEQLVDTWLRERIAGTA